MNPRHLIPVLLVLTLPVSVMGQTPVDLSTLFVQGEQYLDRGSMTPHTGPIFEMWSDGRTVRFRGNLTDGFRDGPWTTYFPNGWVLLSGTFSMGKRTGEWVTYTLDQMSREIMTKGSYDDEGEQCGEWIEMGQTKTYPPCPNG